MNDLNLLTIGYAKRALEPDSREFRRFQTYAEELGGYDAVILTRRRDSLPSYQESGRLRVYGTGTRTRIGMLFSAYFIGRKILRQNSETKFVISAQDPFETGLVAWLLSFRSNAVFHVQVHGDFFSGHGWVNENLLNPWRQRLGYWLLGRAGKIRVVSKRIRDSLVSRGIAASKLVVLPVALSLEEFLLVGKSRNYEEKPNVTFIFVGRLAPEKNLPSLLRAFAEVRLEYPGSRLRLVGTGPEKDKLKSLVDGMSLSSMVEFLAWTDSVPAELAKANILVLPSKHEGYALVLIEAMAAGLPVVTTNVGCVGEHLFSGQQGIVSVSPAPSDLAEAMCAYLKQPSLIETHGRAGHEQAKEIAAGQKHYVKEWAASF